MPFRCARVCQWHNGERHAMTLHNGGKAQGDILASVLEGVCERPVCDEHSVAPVRLRDGAVVLLRAATLPGDTERLIRMFFQLSDDTRYYYFFSGVPATDHWAQRFTALGVANGNTSYVLVAQAEDDLVGLARFDRGPDPSTAEVGIILADGWQSRGLGRYMLTRLSEEAYQRGITTLTGRILGENRRALALARRVFSSLRVAWAGEFEVTASLESTPESSEDEKGER